MLDLAKKYDIHYYSLMEHAEEYQYTDGNHLYKTSARKVTKQIVYYILEIEK